MGQVPPEHDINIATNACFGFVNSTQKGPFMAMLGVRDILAMLISHSRGTYLILDHRNIWLYVFASDSEEIDFEIKVSDCDPRWRPHSRDLFERC